MSEPSSANVTVRPRPKLRTSGKW